ncbi:MULTISPECIES: aminotransferase class V-fold PLP-dependent enzyme [Corallococcus]|uniref:aminotransferase class V-fold PLP-dependent enzyme n=1 Tax=Corallococcus TaxID=83461 RepID=UPI001180941F|nr:MULTISPECIES: aminotransferase class V-fold PLP-dependent enzyme [Corallococcus]NBD10537.1 aminotransferase class V-fold PLP-dependent enzyme [Corallococcus silvisoli]TSC27736.1 aminotransferase class V-fold PLP-dependent enzyme [Corallococcus sp. Z5C101001]
MTVAVLPGALRAEYPLLQSCTYLNSNSTGALPRAAEQVLADYWRTMRAWRDDTWDAWLSQMQAYADGVAGLIGAPAGCVALDTNLSAHLSRLGTCLDFSGERRRVVVTDLEFPTVPFIWKGFARYGAELVVVPSKDGRVDEAALEAAIDARTRLVCVSHGAFATGALLDVARVARAAHAAGALIATDAYQTVGAVPVDVRALDVDFLLGGAHKWLGGSETAFMYVRPELLPTLRPAATGWLAGASPLGFQQTSDYAPDARRMMGGTPAPLMVLLSRPGLELLKGVGMGAVREHSLQLTDRLMARADEAGLHVVTPREPHRRGGVVALRFPGDAQVTQRLVARGFICSHRGFLRAAPHFYNTLEEVDAFMDALLHEQRKEAA